MKVDVTVNIARTADEAKIQRETGKALIAEDDETIEEVVQETVKDIKDETASETEAA